MAGLMGGAVVMFWATAMTSHHCTSDKPRCWGRDVILKTLAMAIVGSRVWAFDSAWRLANRTNAYYRRRLGLNDAGLAMFRGTTVSAVVTIAVIVSGCDPVSRDESLATEDHGFTVRDSAGIEIVENHASRYAAEVFRAIDPEPEIVVADDSARLDWAAGIARLPDGRAVVLSFSNKRLFIFEPSGELSRTIGRPGEGPGEFGIPELMQYLPPDTLVVWERFGASVDYFDTAGTLLRERSVDYARLMEHGGTYENPFRLPLPDGSFLIGVGRRAAGQPQEDCSHLDSRISFAGQDEITVPGEQLIRIDDANAAHPFGCSRPGSGSRMAVGGDPLAVYIGNTGGEVHLLPLLGREGLFPDGSARRVGQGEGGGVPDSAGASRTCRRGIGLVTTRRDTGNRGAEVSQII